MKSGVLIALLVLSGTGYGLYRLFSSQPPATFSARLLHLDTARVTSIVLSPGTDTTEWSLLREAGTWIASNGQTHLKAAPAAVQALLGELRSVRIQEVVAKDPDSWRTFGVDAVQGVRVRLYAGKQLLDDFVLGTADQDPQTQAPLSYLRLSGEHEVYAVRGNLVAHVQQDFAAFRNNTILTLDKNMKINALEIQLPDTTLQFAPTAAGWMAGNTPLDSTRLTQYLQSLRSLSSAQFADDFDEVQGSKYLYQTLILHTNAQEEPLILTCYRDTLRQPPFIIHSSQNPEVFFESDSTGMYQVIFKNWIDFHKKVKEDAILVK